MFSPTRRHAGKTRRIASQEEITMDINSYCGNLACELRGWQHKIQDVVNKIDSADCGDKTRLVPQVNELHMILEEFDDRIQLLKTEEQGDELCALYRLENCNPERGVVMKKKMMIPTKWAIS
jgi:hypothetical protein